MGKLPALQFYPGDWRKDIGVQSLTFHDRGIWFEMLMLMHESDIRGMLVLNGRPMPIESLARLLGLDIHVVNQTLSNLITTGVASVEPNSGAIMCRRMVRDENIRKVRTEAGKKGGNPVLLNQNPTTGVKQIPTPSSSSSSSSTKISTIARFTPSDIESIYQQYPRKKSPERAKKAIKKALENLDDEDPVKALRARVMEYAASPAGHKEQRFIPYPATWFNDKCYTEDPKEWEQ
ncbi:MAG TPA: hypothetical protein VMQ60_01630 [Acidobacteriaceae bacterium]|nr:hypothetical protein [Acidobacteriaceae bacterium]